jgi:pimeloyl-ACP methyl ester carboxylesterase
MAGKGFSVASFANSALMGDMHRILLLTGMTPDHRIFERLLPLLPSAMCVDWIQPTSTFESINSYAARLSRTLDDNSPTVVCGASFGGIVARELALCLNAKACVLISSVRSPRELPPNQPCQRLEYRSLLASMMNEVGNLRHDESLHGQTNAVA